MSKKAGTNTTTQSMDPQTQAYIQQIQQAAQQAGQTGGATNQYAGAGGPVATQYQNMMNGGNLGFNALSGNSQALSQLMNPYQQQVIDANNKQWGNINAQTQNQLSGAATKANAFGGSRYGVALGSALSQNNIGQGQQTASLLQGGYNTAMGQANSLANLGFGATQGLNQLGQQNVAQTNTNNSYLMNMLRQGYMGPTGSTNTQSSSPSGLSSMLGWGQLLGSLGAAPFTGGMSLLGMGGGGGGGAAPGWNGGWGS